MLPPYWLATFVLVAVGLRLWYPVVLLPALPARICAVVLVLAGATLAAWGERQFAVAKTGVIPGREITTFVRSGPYRFTRNPMYLGMVIAFAGVCLATRAASTLVLPPLLLLVLAGRFVPHEERMLRQRFGDEAAQGYFDEVRRWL